MNVRVSDYVEVKKPTLTQFATLIGLVVIAWGAIYGYAQLKDDVGDLKDSAVTKSELEAVRTELKNGLDAVQRDRESRLGGYQEEREANKATRAQVSETKFAVDQTVKAIAAGEARDAATNQRMDRIVESFGTKLDTVITKQTEQTIKLEVIQDEQKAFREDLKQADRRSFLFKTPDEYKRPAVAER